MNNFTIEDINKYSEWLEHYHTPIRSGENLSNDFKQELLKKLNLFINSNDYVFNFNGNVKNNGLDNVREVFALMRYMQDVNNRINSITHHPSMLVADKSLEPDFIVKTDSGIDIIEIYSPEKIGRDTFNMGLLNKRVQLESKISSKLKKYENYIETGKATKIIVLTDMYTMYAKKIIQDIKNYFSQLPNLNFNYSAIDNDTMLVCIKK